MPVMKKGINSNVNDEVTSFKPSLVDEIKLEEKKTGKCAKEQRKVEDQKTRAMNFICFKVQESDENSLRVNRNSFDENVVKELSELVNFPTPDVKALLRLGHPADKPGNQIRPLKINFNNNKARQDHIR